jgi:hypothetical protein
MRVLFFNEGNLGTHVLGHAQLDAALRSGLESQPDVEARFASLSPMGRRAEMIAGHPLKPLASAGLDFQTLRWHLVEPASNSIASWRRGPQMSCTCTATRSPSG